MIALVVAAAVWLPTAALLALTIGKAIRIADQREQSNR